MLDDRPAVLFAADVSSYGDCAPACRFDLVHMLDQLVEGTRRQHDPGTQPGALACRCSPQAA
jgi:hypothetical protein